MRITMTLAVAAAALATALPAMAQSGRSAAAGSAAVQSPAASSEAAPSTGAATGSATGASAQASAPAAAALAVGLPVKDKTGAVIGEITELKPDADGQTATVKMGEQTFAIGSKSFVVQNGAAVINATQAELKAMIANAAKAG